MKISPVQRALLAVLLFTVLFALLMVGTAYLWTHEAQRLAMVCFIAAFIAMLCQIGTFLLFIRQKQLQQLRQQQKENHHVSSK